MSTRPIHEINWRKIAMDPDVSRLAAWAAAREEENVSQRAAVQLANRWLMTAFGSWCTATGHEKADGLRYRTVAQILGLRNPITTCNALPLAQLRECAQWFAAETERVTGKASRSTWDADNLASLETTDPAAGRRVAA